MIEIQLENPNGDTALVTFDTPTANDFGQPEYDLESSPAIFVNYRQTPDNYGHIHTDKITPMSFVSVAEKLGLTVTTNFEIEQKDADDESDF